MSRIYKTNQRRIILEFLAAGPGGHFTAGEIFAVLKAGGLSISRATVYRHLEKLSAEGLLYKYSQPDGAAADYEYRGRSGGSHHLKCVVCGKLLHFECVDISRLYRHIGKNHGLIIDSARTVFSGTCGECGKNREKRSGI